jgi:hypothetical protein
MVPPWAILALNNHTTTHTTTMLNRSITTTLAALAIAGASVTAAYASEEALLDALVKKGVLKQADAQKIKAESAHHGSGGNSKIKLNESVKQLDLYGSLNLRWQHVQAQNQADALTGHGFQDQSARFRLLLGTRFTLTDGVFGGVELSTGNSGNNPATGGGGGSNNANDRYNTFGRSAGDYTLVLSKAYVGWHATPEITVIGGRQSVPFYSTEMVWDNDVRLDGVTEKVDLGKLLGLGDGLGLKLVAGQFVMGDNQSYTAYQGGNNGHNNQDAWMYQTQLQISAALGDAKLTVAPAVLWGNGADAQGFTNGTAGVPGPATPTSGGNYVSNLTSLLVPGDVSFQVAGTPVKFLWDFAYNFGATGVSAGNNLLTGNTNAPGDQSSAQDRMAWLVGIQAGQNKHKGDFSVSANYRELGSGALLGAFTDSDFAFGRLNQRGFQIGAAYSLTNSTKLSAKYSASTNIDQEGAGSVNNGIFSDLNTTQLVTIDLGVKF